MADVSVSSAPASSTQGAPLGDDVKPVDGAMWSMWEPREGPFGSLWKGEVFFWHV